MFALTAVHLGPVDIISVYKDVSRFVRITFPIHLEATNNQTRIVQPLLVSRTRI